MSKVEYKNDMIINDIRYLLQEPNYIHIAMEFFDKTR